MTGAPGPAFVRRTLQAATRRRLLGRGIGLALTQALLPTERAARSKSKSKKKKLTVCQGGQTLTIAKKKKKAVLKQGATLGPCPPTSPPPTSPPPSPPPPPCVASCTGKDCGDNGCGGSCGSCGSGAVCQGGLCLCRPERICGEVCCAEAVACFPEGCICEEFVCSCTAGRTFCSTPDFTQCCAPGDDCDPVAACVTDTCSAENDVCTTGAAFCGDGFCLCTTKASGEPFCADFDDMDDCPAASACEEDDDCAAGQSCANVPCCIAGSEAFFGVCLPDCAAAQRARRAPGDPARQRRHLARTLHLNLISDSSRLPDH